MSLFTLTGNKLAATVLAAGALVVSGAGVTAVAASLQDSTAVAEAESPSASPTATESESPEPSPTSTETESPSPSPTATESESPEPSPTATETESPEPTETATPSPSPSESDESSTSAAAVGPDATGPAAFGLCNAFTHGGLGVKSTARAALVKAAGGESRIVSYCADVTAAKGADDDATETSTGQELTGPEQTEQQAEPQQQVEQERQGAPGQRVGKGHQSGNPQNHSRNSHAQSGGRG